MKALLSESDFQVVYSHYLDGKDMYTLAEENWQKYGYASAESFRISFRSKCFRRGLPVRDVPASRRKTPTGMRTRTQYKLTPEMRELLKKEISKKRKVIVKREVNIKYGTAE